MFSLFTLKGALRVWQVNYCESDFTRCARYRVAQEGKRVPSNLLPNGNKLELPDEGARAK